MANEIVPVNSGTAVKAIIPSDFDSVLEFSRLVAASGLAPASLKTPEAISVAIMHGYELGLTPMASLQSIAVVNGRATVWGDGALALVMASGQFEDISEWIDGEGETAVAYCKLKRKGRAEIVSTFSMKDAKTAKLLNKQGPWQEYPLRMLKLRARAFALRDGFADVLRGIGIAEEVRDAEQARDITPPAPTESAPPAPTETAKPAAARVVEPAEIIPPKPQSEKPREEQKPAAEKRQETPPAAEERAPAPPREETKKEASPSAQEGGKARVAFGAYLEVLDKQLTDLRSAGDVDSVEAGLKKVWANRDLSYEKESEENKAAIFKLRDKHRDWLAKERQRIADEREAATQREIAEASGAIDPSDEGEEFSEFDYRAVFATRIASLKSDTEVIDLKDEVDDLREKGLIVPSRYAEFYEPALEEAFNKF